MPFVATPPRNACTVRLKRPHARQVAFITSTRPRRIIRAGRRSGKTTGLAIYAVQEFLKGERILYTAPVGDQVLRFWHEVSRALAEPIEAGLYTKNETLHIIERAQTEQRIRAKSAWSADTLRGDYCTRLIMDEWQLCAEEAWHLVGAPMMLDKEGSTAIFCYTPPSLHTLGVSKAEDPMHAAKMFAAAQKDTTGRWEAFNFTSHDNPYLSQIALHEITQDMSALAYKREILAEDELETPGALWTQQLIDAHRWQGPFPAFVRIVVGLDPGHNAGIVVVGKCADGRAVVLDDLSIAGTPEVWAAQAITGYYKYGAHALIVERNHGGEMAEATLRNVDRAVNVKTVWASHGKYARAEPASVLYPKDKVYHFGVFRELEAEMTTWVPETGQPSPDRLDALVWCISELMLQNTGPARMMELTF